MRSKSVVLALLLCPAVAPAADLPDLRPPPPAEKPQSPFVFQLLPKSFQKHPALDFHVITEMTAEGRKLSPPTPAHPVYYLAQAGKFSQLGHNTPANEHAPDVTELTHAMQRALAESNFVPATPASPLPSIAVVFNYGSFARFSTDSFDLQQMSTMEQLTQDADGGPTLFLPTDGDRGADALLPMVLSDPIARKDVLERAELIGGDKFARELKDVLNQEALHKQAQSSLLPAAMEFSSPFHRFMNANTEMMTLVEESFSSCYFVIASAYDYVAMKKGQRVLLWRTKMTVNSSGIAMSESLPSLVVAAGPYFGRDMPAAVTLTRKITREGKVEVGTPRVVDYSEPTTSPTTSGAIPHK